MKRTEIVQLEDPALVERLAALLRGRAPFSELDAPLATNLARSGAMLELDAGEALIRENEPAGAEIYLLVAGGLVVQSQAQFIARLDRPGDIVGEVSVLLSSRRTADVVADAPTRVMAIPSKLLAQPEFAPLAAGMRRAMLRDDWVQY